MNIALFEIKSGKCFPRRAFGVGWQMCLTFHPYLPTPRPPKEGICKYLSIFICFIFRLVFVRTIHYMHLSRPNNVCWDLSTKLSKFQGLLGTAVWQWQRIGASLSGDKALWQLPHQWYLLKHFNYFCSWNCDKALCCSNNILWYLLIIFISAPFSPIC